MPNTIQLLSSSPKNQTEKHLQSKLQDYIKKLPFFQAVDLFEDQNNLALCYELFVECALAGNAYALFYIKHLQDNFPSEIDKKDNVVVNHLEYFLRNVPNLDNVDPKYWLDVSLIKQEYKHKLIINKKEQKDILNKLFDLARYCSAGYILLQDIIYNDVQHIHISLTETEQQQWIKKLKSIEPKVIDLFMMAYIKNDNQCNNYALIGTYFISDLNNILKLIDKDGIEVYRLHGILEREIANLEYYGVLTKMSDSDKGLIRSRKKQDDQAYRKLRWQKSGAFMGNDQLYMMFSLSTKLNEENKMKSALFAALAGNLSCKSKLSQLMGSLSLKAGRQQIPEEMINPQLGEEWLLSFGELTIEQAMFYIKKNISSEAAAATDASNAYVNCGQLLERYAKKTTESQSKQQDLEKAFSCYLKAAKLGNSVGFFNAGIFYQYNMLNNNSDHETNIKFAIAMYSRAFDLNHLDAVNKLISLNYGIKNYEEIYKYINNLILKKISIISFEDKVPIIYAEMLKYGFGGFAVDKDLAYKIIIDSANKGNKHSKLAIIQDFVCENQFAGKLLTSKKLLKIGLDLYDCYKSSSDNQVVLMSTPALVTFFSRQEFVNQGGRDIALELINQGLLDNNLAIKIIFAEFSLYGNRHLNIPENGSITLKYLNEVLTVDGNIVEENKPVIYNQMGVAYMRGVGLDVDYRLAEEYLQQAYLLKADYAEYNLSCLYYKMNLFTEAFTYLSEAFTLYPDDSDVLCDIATHYLSGLGVKENFDLANLYINKSFQLNNNRAIPNLVIINILNAFLDQNLTLTLEQCEKLLSNYIDSSELTLHNNKDKNLLYLVEAGLALLNRPFEYPAVIQKLKSIVDADYFIEFAIQYLENKPHNRNVNYLGVDLLCIILLLNECKTVAELKQLFNQHGLCLQLQQPKNLKSSQQSTDKNSHDFDSNKIDKFKEELARFIHKDPKAKLSFKDLKKLCFTSSILFPDKTPCKITHATNGSGEKIELCKTDLHFPSVLSFHPEHRSCRSKGEKHDPNREKAIKQFATSLQSRLLP